jgi:hypothetical protein
VILMKESSKRPILDAYGKYSEMYDKSDKAKITTMERFMNFRPSW